MKRLRAETRRHHEEAEGCIDLDRVAASRGAYAALLRRLLGFYAPVEERLGRLPWPEAGLDFEARRKADWLRGDLLAIGDAAGGEVGRCEELPVLDGLARGLGCLYVLEGATLGGRIILGRVAEGLGVGPTAGARFFDGYGDRTGPMWTAFGRLADRHVAARPAAADAVIGAACETFDAFRRWLSAGDGGR